MVSRPCAVGYVAWAAADVVCSAACAVFLSKGEIVSWVLAGDRVVVSSVSCWAFFLW